MSKSVITILIAAAVLGLTSLTAAPEPAAIAPATQDSTTPKPEKKDPTAATKPKAAKAKPATAKQRPGKPDPETKKDSGPDATITVSSDDADETAAPENPHIKKLSEEVTLLTLERDKLLAENAIAKEKIVKQLAERKAATDFIEMELEEAELEMKRSAIKLKSELDKELAELRAEKDRLVLNAEIAKAKTDAEVSRMKLIEEERKSKLAKLTSEIAQKEKEMERDNYTEEKPVYLKNPLQEKKLIISDRRIALNGPIFGDTADYISERINYFNNKDKELPIFIVIDYSPGGSVMSGYKILKAMEGSQAPVYVVVKSFAASMAACITTLADKSFAYPNALVLHHQLAGGSFGNLTQQREFVEEAEEWWRRLAGPVAEKMGVDLEEFIKMMYDNASTGDWVEFADDSRNLKWVDHIIEEIRETSLIKNPDAKKADEKTKKPSTYHYGREEQTDEDGKPYVNLPRLAPYDYYWLYNPDGYYRSK